MTLIIGMNLSDRIYLAGDTRITQTTNNGYRFIDNVIKICPIFGKNVITAGQPLCQSNNLISAAIAGNVAFASFIYSEIKDAIDREYLNHDIRLLYKQIDDLFIGTLANKWLSTGNEYGAKCCLIFGGTEHGRNKDITKEKLDIMMEQYKIEHTLTEDKQKELEDILKTDKIMQLINKGTMRDAGKSVIQLIDESSKPELPAHIQMAIQKNSETLTDLPDSLVFCIEIEISKHGLTFSKHKAEWGQFIARGSQRLTEGDLPEDILSMLELMPGKEKTKEHLFEGSLIDKIILDIAKQKDIPTIGGSVVINCLKKDTSKIMSRNCKFINGQIYIEVLSQLIPAIGFEEFLKIIKNASRAEM